MSCIDITVHVSTRGRYFTTLPLFLTSVANQTLKPKEIIIYDDNTPPQDLRKHPLYEYIFGLFESKGIAWKVGYGAGKGQIWNHQKALTEATTDWMYRGDDDTVLEPNALEILASSVDEKTGAAAPVVLHPNRPILDLPPHFSHNKIEFCEDPGQMNIQWFRHPDGSVKKADHLYSTFLYRKDASKHGYNLNLSPVAHREESFFTWGMRKAGWELLVVPRAIVYHFRYSEGGIRGQYHSKENFDHDSNLFLEQLRLDGVQLKTKKVIQLDCGLGDTIVFSKLMPELKKKYPNLVLSVCFPEVFAGETGVEIISIAQANYFGNYYDENVYKCMDFWGWKGTLEDAFRRLYLE